MKKSYNHARIQEGMERIENAFLNNEQDAEMIYASNIYYRVVKALNNDDLYAFANLKLSYTFDFDKVLFGMTSTMGTSKVLKTEDVKFLLLKMLEFNMQLVMSSPYEYNGLYDVLLNNGIKKEEANYFLKDILEIRKVTEDANYIKFGINKNKIKNNIIDSEEVRLDYVRFYKPIKELYNNLSEENILKIGNIFRNKGYQSEAIRLLEEELRRVLEREKYLKKKKVKDNKGVVVNIKSTFKPIHVGITIKEEKEILTKRKEFLNSIRVLKRNISILEYLNYIDSNKYADSNKEMLWSELQELFPLIELDEDTIVFLEQKAREVGKKDFDVLELMNEINEVKLELNSSLEEDKMLWNEYLNELYSKLKLLLAHNFNYEYALSIRK